MHEVLVHMTPLLVLVIPALRAPLGPAHTLDADGWHTH